jgi:hypothetical protein
MEYLPYAIYEDFLKNNIDLLKEDADRPNFNV